ncbi:hypothetical protein GCM10008111_16310 [Alishewanella tabrizica]|uniref:Uncharacterized protein n=1 Tax=Alishewanella tabrizica TaxID=671278 RepID=A0ABQ2WMB2_9ALTE|nr:hypothetical protein GCM10008111_16310 [Alishewanella tabrizica]
MNIAVTGTDMGANVGADVITGANINVNSAAITATWDTRSANLILNVPYRIAL